MARDPGAYSEEIMREFYASYATTLRGSISKKSKPLDQDLLTMVRGCPVDISQATINRFLYGPTTGYTWSLNTEEFDYRWDIVRSGAFQRNVEQREAVILWLAKYIVVDGERVEWVATPRLGIQKATLNFAAKFFWLLVRNMVSPTKVDNQLTWDRVVMVAALVAGVQIDFTRMLLAEIHERAFKTSTTYPFPCLIRDETNVAAPRRDPQVEVPPLGADLADTVGQAHGGGPIIPDHSDTVPASSSQAPSMAPTSARSTPQLGATVVPLARVQKLEAQMATLMHHIQPWMQKSIAESEARMEQRMEGMMDRKAELASLRADVDAILDTPTVEPQAAPTALADDTVLDTLFSGTVEEESAPTHTKGASSLTPVIEVPLVVRDVVSTTAGVVRVIESTTEGAMMDDVGTTKGDPTIVPVGSRKPDPPAC
uniref:Integrase core domain containing protein n=1 Tax=Solanum tuberosum TaxID=4113 RepID=M1E0N2_SOLTU